MVCHCMGNVHYRIFLYSDMKGEIMRNKGFTLIELMIVIAIIAILAAIVIPNAINIMSKGDNGRETIQVMTQEEEAAMEKGEKPIAEKLIKPKKPKVDDDNPYGNTEDKY